MPHCPSLESPASMLTEFRYIPQTHLVAQPTDQPLKYDIGWHF
jgi:hypothetical protein